MRLCFFLFVVLAFTEAVSIGRVGKLFNVALAAQKKGKNGRRGETNVAHNKASKIKVVDLKTLEDGKINGQEKLGVLGNGGGKRMEALVKKQNAYIKGQQLALSVVSMIASRYLFKINYKDPRALMYTRLTFILYLGFYQALIWFLTRQINKRDDHTILHKNPAVGLDTLLSKFGASGSANPLISVAQLASKLAKSKEETTLTVKAHDLQQIKDLSRQLRSTLFFTSVVHFLLGYHMPIVMAPIHGITNLLNNNLVLLHVFRMKPVGLLERPFKSPMEQFMQTASTLVPVVPSVKEGEPVEAEKAPPADTVARGVEDSEDIDADVEIESDVVHNEAGEMEVDGGSSEGEEDDLDDVDDIEIEDVAELSDDDADATEQEVNEEPVEEEVLAGRESAEIVVEADQPDSEVMLAEESQSVPESVAEDTTQGGGGEGENQKQEGDDQVEAAVEEEVEEDAEEEVEDEEVQQQQDDEDSEESDEQDEDIDADQERDNDDEEDNDDSSDDREEEEDVEEEEEEEELEESNTEDDGDSDFLDAIDRLGE